MGTSKSVSDGRAIVILSEAKDLIPVDVSDALKRTRSFRRFATQDDDADRTRRLAIRKGLTLVEVVVALMILGGVLLTLGAFSMRMSMATSRAQLRVTGAQLAADRLEAVKGAPRYAAIESLYVATEAVIPNYPGYSRKTMVTHVGGGFSDTTDYKVVTIWVNYTQLTDTISRTTVIAAF